MTALAKDAETAQTATRPLLHENTAAFVLLDVLPLVLLALFILGYGLHKWRNCQKSKKRLGVHPGSDSETPQNVDYSGSANRDGGWSTQHSPVDSGGDADGGGGEH